jgi:CBS domain-containing protein
MSSDATLTTAVRTPADPVSTIMSTPVAEISGWSTLSQVAETLAAADIGALLVVEGATIFGVLSERDVVRALADNADPDVVLAADIVAPETVWAGPTDSIRYVAGLMREAEVRHIPLRAGDQVVGIVSIRDVIGVLLDSH